MPGRQVEDSFLKFGWRRADSPHDRVLPAAQIDTTIQEVCAALTEDRARNELIVADLLHAVGEQRSPLLLTGRTNHLKHFETAISGKVSNVFVLKGGMGKKQRRTIAEAIAAVPESEPRVILATGSYIGEGFVS